MWATWTCSMVRAEPRIHPYRQALKLGEGQGGSSSFHLPASFLDDSHRPLILRTLVYFSPSPNFSHHQVRPFLATRLTGITWNLIRVILQGLVLPRPGSHSANVFWISFSLGSSQASSKPHPSLPTSLSSEAVHLARCLPPRTLRSPSTRSSPRFVDTPPYELVAQLRRKRRVP